MINFKAYAAFTLSTLRLTLRDRVVLFFSYIFPLLFFIAFGEGFGASQGTGAATQVVTMVLVLGVLGNGFFGGGMRATMEREMGILRRFKVAPITAAPILVASMVTGWVIYMPALALFLGIAKVRYGMPLPSNMISLVALVSLGVVAFRAMGLIIASVANSMAESQIIIQLLYFPMLLLSGATIPLTTLPEWLQVVAQFLPATHVYLGMQGIMMRNESIWDHGTAVLALSMATLVSMFISVKLFRWEKEEKLRPHAKAWVAAALLPFVALGAWEAWTKTNLQKTKILAREQRRSMSWLIRDARIITGTGAVIEPGSVLIRNGKIEQIFEGRSPDAKELRAEAMEASGRTLLPGLIDLAIEIDGPSEATVSRALRAELYSGVTGAGVVSDNPAGVAAFVQKVMSGEILGAEILRVSGKSAKAPLPLVAVEWAEADGAPALLSRSLTQQLLPPSQIEALKRSHSPSKTEGVTGVASPMSMGGWKNLPYGASMHRQLQLMVRSGMSPADALLAATRGAAQKMGRDDLGAIQPGAAANLVLVDGNPLEEIGATERIVAVFLRGERVSRASLAESGH